MTEQTAEAENEQPTTCPHCGTELVSGTVDFAETPDETESADLERATFQPGQMAAVEYCPNPDCPGNVA